MSKKRNRGIFLITLLVLIIGVIFLSNFIEAADSVGLEARVTSAQNALNARGFDAASAVGTTFTDSISPYTGTLTVTLTDVFVRGRNGLNIQLTRSYNSNVFLNVNQRPGGGTFTCDNPNNFACDVQNPVEFCTVPDRLSNDHLDDGGLAMNPGVGETRPMNTCDDGGYQQPSSFKRPGILGFGWDMTPGKFVDPTLLLFEIANDGTSRKTLQYRYISARGINSMGLIIDNNKQDLILPSMYRENPTSEIELMPSLSFWSNDVGNDGEIKFYSYGDDINGVGIPNDEVDDNIVMAQNENFGRAILANQGRTFPVYTSDLSPVFLTYPSLSDLMRISVGGKLGALVTTGEYKAVYYDKAGKEYQFDHHVTFCSKFDDMRGYSNPGFCSSIYAKYLVKWKWENIFNWAENPYPGLYLTKVTDMFGNQISYTYRGSSSDPSPFINTVTGPNGNIVTFGYGTPTPSGVDSGGALDINSKITYIKYPNPSIPGAFLHSVYRYSQPKPKGTIPFTPTLNGRGECEAYLENSYDQDIPAACSCGGIIGGNQICTIEEVDAIPLLEFSCVSTQPNCVRPSEVVAGTLYRYHYDPETRELIQVDLPTGAKIKYEYAWAHNLPAFDLLAVNDDLSDYQTMSKRVIVSRTVFNSDETCPDKVIAGIRPSGGNSCVWVYQYKTVRRDIFIKDFNGNPVSRSYYELETTVHDPFGAKTVYNLYPTTLTPMSYF